MLLYDFASIPDGIRMCEQVIASEPGNREALMLLGDLHRSPFNEGKSDRFLLALAAYKRALETGPCEASVKAMIWGQVSLTFFGMGRKEIATSYARQARLIAGDTKIGTYFKVVRESLTKYFPQEDQKPASLSEEPWNEPLVLPDVDMKAGTIHVVYGGKEETINVATISKPAPQRWLHTPSLKL